MKALLKIVLFSAVLLAAQIPGKAAVVLLQQPESVVVLEGDSAVFQVSALGLGLRYQWYKNGTTIKGATDASLTISPVSAADEGEYHAVVSALLGTTKSHTASLSLVRPVQIASHPAAQSVNAGESVVLSVHATGSPGPFYQWTLNGENIPGANESTLTLRNVLPGDGGSYQVLVFNGYEVVNSAEALVSVNLPVLPFSDSISARGTIVGASGLGSGHNLGASHEASEPVYLGANSRGSVWLKWIAPESGYASFWTAGSSFDTLLGAFQVKGTALEYLDSDDDSSDYHTSLVQFNVQRGAEYAIVVDGEEASSGQIVLGWNLTAGRMMPVITSQPLSETIGLGQLLSLTLGIDFSGDYKVRWYRNGEPIPNLFGTVLHLLSVLGLPVGVYQAEITTESSDVFFSDQAEVQMNTEGLKAGARNKRVQAAGLGISGTGALSGFSIGRLRAFGDISGSAGYSGTQIFQTQPGRDPGEPNHCGVVGGSSYWLAYRAPANGVLTLSTDGSTFDTLLAVYIDNGTGLGYGSLVSAACDNNSGADGRDSRVSFDVYGGQTYYIAVDGVYGATGTAYLKYSLTQRPTISSVGSFSMAEGSTASRSFTVSGNGNLTVTASTSNTSVISSWNISVTGSGSQRSISLRPTGSGQATISLTVRDSSGMVNSTSFTVYVTASNRPPVAGSDYVYRSSRYGALTIYLPNLLQNDSDPDGDSLSVYSCAPKSSNGAKIERSGNYLYYYPVSTAGDAFTYSIADGKGGYASGWVSVY